MSPEQSISTLVENDKLVTFGGGILELPNIARKSPIISMGYGSQQISAAVEGTTDEALFVCQRLLLTLWQAAGTNASWNELRNEVGRIRYKTTTKVQLGVPLRSLLASSFQTFLQESIESATGYGSRMGLVPLDEDELRAESPSITAVGYCREIDLRVCVFDKVSGRSEENVLNLVISTRVDANRSWVNITSELPSDQHSGLVETLVHEIGQA